MVAALSLRANPRSLAAANTLMIVTGVLRYMTINSLEYYQLQSGALLTLICKRSLGKLP